jgi:hypothetical protein
VARREIGGVNITVIVLFNRATRFGSLPENIGVAYLDNTCPRMAK